MNRTIELRQRARIPRVLLAAAFAMFTILVMRIISVESPVMASDEYAYFMTAKYDAVRQDVYRYDPAMQAVDNQIYPLLFDAWQAVSPERTALVGRVSNALLYVLSAFVLFMLFQRVFDRRTATLSALLYLLFPFSFYATTVLPEVEFQFLVYVSVLLALWSTTVRTPMAVLLPGITSGIAYFVKPHAAALIVAVGAFYAVAGVLVPVDVAARLRVRMAASLCRMALYFLTVIVIVYFGRRMSTDGQPGGATLVASFYGSYLSRLSSPSYLLQNFWSMLDYVAGHAWAMSTMFAPGMLAVGAIWARSLRGLRAGGQADGGSTEWRERTLLALLVGFLCLAFLLMIAAFTNSASQVSQFEKYRLHGRYLEPLLPLLLAFSVWTVDHSRRLLAIGLALLSALALFAFYLRFQYHLYPWDYPDVFVFFTSKMRHWAMEGTNDWLIWLVLLFGAAFAICCALRRFQLPVYIIFLAVTMLGSHVQMSNWLRLHSETNRAAIEAGDALRDYLGQTSPGSGLVLVSDRYGRSSYFLMEFSSLQHIQSIAPGARFDGPVPEGVEWIIAPEGVVVGIEDSRRIAFGEQVLYMLGGKGSDADTEVQKVTQEAAPASRQATGSDADIGDDVRVYEFADAGLDESVEGFHAREPWGRWSSSRTSTLTLSTPVQGHIKMVLSGWLATTHPERRVRVRLGNDEQVVTMTSQPDNYSLQFELTGPARSIEFETVPVRVADDGRPLGIAITRVRLESQN